MFNHSHYQNIQFQSRNRCFDNYLIIGEKCVPQSVRLLEGVEMLHIRQNSGWNCIRLMWGFPYQLKGRACCTRWGMDRWALVWCEVPTTPPLRPPPQPLLQPNSTMLRSVKKQGVSIRHQHKKHPTENGLNKSTTPTNPCQSCANPAWPKQPPCSRTQIHFCCTQQPHSVTLFRSVFKLFNFGHLSNWAFFCCRSPLRASSR